MEKKRKIKLIVELVFKGRETFKNTLKLVNNKKIDRLQYNN